MSSAAVIEGACTLGASRSRRSPGITDCLGSGRAECSDLDFLLVKIREILLQGTDACRTEEHQHVIIKSLICSKVIADSTVHDSFRVLNLILIQQILHVIIVYIRHWYQVLFSLMLNNGRYQIVNLPGVSEENLTLTILHILLDIQSNGLRHAEILHCFGNCHTQFCTQVEEMINSMTRSKK